MKHSIKSLSCIALLAISASAIAHGDVPPPKHGGLVAEVRDVAYEFVAKPDALAIYVEDHGKAVDTKGATAKVTLLSGGEKTEALLLPAGDNKLEAKGTFKVAAGTKAVTVVTIVGKPAAAARFEVK